MESAVALRRIAGLLLALAALPAGAQYVPPNAPKTDEDKAFYSAVARSIFAVIPGERGKFGLTLDDRHPPTFCGHEANTIELGHLGASVCSNGAKARELSLRAKSHLAALARQSGAKEEDLRKAGWTFTQETLPDGAEYFYFPVLIVSHGVVGPVTGVLHDRKTGRALVVQTEVRQMCGENFKDEFKAAPFCTDLAGSVKRVVLALRSLL